MNIAVVTGASSGLGIEYIKNICERYTDIQQIWIVARRKDRLEKIANEYPDKKIIPIELDLTQYESYEKFNQLLIKADANIKIFIKHFCIFQKVIKFCHIFTLYILCFSMFSRYAK